MTITHLCSDISGQSSTGSQILLLFTPIQLSANLRAPTFDESPWDASGVKEIQF